MIKGMFVAVVAFVASGSSPAALTDANEIDSVIENLDLTSFPNSIGPRRVSGKTTFVDYGFVHIEKTSVGADLIREDRGWMMGFRIVSAGPRSLRLCFYDRGIAKSGHLTPSYNATSALLVSKRPSGRWTANQASAGFANCQNDPPAA